MIFMKFRRLILFCSILALFSACSQKNANSIIDDSKEYFSNFSGSVSYLGPKGTYTQEAAQKFFGENAKFIASKTVSDAVLSVINQTCTFAVIPQENTIGGPVYDYLDELLKYENLFIFGEVELPIRQALLAKEGTELSSIKTVYSHKQGLIQGKDWLEKNIPGVQLVEVSSTAKGAEIVSASYEKDCAAIASSAACGVYGLTVLQKDVQQNENNKTRFYILSAKEPFTERKERMVFVATGNAENLLKLTDSLSKNKFSLVSIHARPAKTTLGEYKYLIECKNAGYDDFKKIASFEKFAFRYAGSFCVE